MLYELARAYEPPEDARGHVEVVFRGPKPQGLFVLGQEGPLGQVFRNLIDNARSFSPEGGHVFVSAEVTRTKDGQFIRATIDDEGPGIPEDGKQLRAGVGISNVRSRLRNLYGESSNLTIQNRDHGVEVQLSVPYQAK